MPRTFLGKSVPSSKETLPKRPERKSWILFVLAPAVLLSSSLYLLNSSFPSLSVSSQSISNPARSAQTNQRAFAAISGSASQTITLADASGVDPANPCSIASLKAANINIGAIFPLLPAGIMPTAVPSGTEVSPTSPAKVCTPAFWNIDIVCIFLYKALAILNYLAGALAVIFTVYAGLLYISGVASEANVKKAKAILIATYLGLLIVIFAKVIVYGPIAHLSADGSNTIDPNTVLGLPAN